MAETAQPLYRLTKKDVPFVWGSEQEGSFLKLKNSLVDKLVMPDFSQPFIVETDASLVGLGCVISQAHGVIAYSSRSLSGSESRYPPARLEALVLVWALQKFRHLLWGGPHPIQVLTDNMGVKFLRECKTSSMLIRWALVLQDFQLEIKHRPGRLSGNVDALSRNPAKFRQSIDQEFLQVDAAPSNFAQGLWESQEESFKDWDGKDAGGFARDKLGRIRIPRDHVEQMVSWFHDQSHAGVSKKYSALNRRFTWDGMKESARDYVSRCGQCQKYKPYVNERKEFKKVKFEEKFASVVMDLKDFSRSPSMGMKYVLVIVDPVTRWAEFLPLPAKDAKTVAKAFFYDWVCRYGMPKHLKSDRGREFHNQFLHEMVVLTGSVHEFGRLEHHNDQAHVERLMRTIEEALICVTQGKKSKWAEALGAFGLMYRSSVHSVIKTSPFQRVFEQDLRLPVDVLIDSQEENLKCSDKLEGSLNKG
eukprot:TRINITY_DN4632_c0_g1_i6.p1 TRINITY_DN4632_c0_g1~~TRINITY_DN4632_c0_g1_i6.p1  ORF type:complete len:542 (-),score=46.32 TRINITY_DN4632_c0_g1_i6:398-1822(-)